MKEKSFLSIMLCMTTFLMIGAIFIGCGEEDYTTPSATYISVTPSSIEIEATGGSETVQLECDGKWYVSSDVPSWIVVGTTKHFTSTKINIYVLGANSGTSARSATIYFMAENKSTYATLRVTQKGKGSSIDPDPNPDPDPDPDPSSGVPSTPTGLTASQAGPKAYAYVALSWDFKYDSNLDHYNIYRSTSQYGSYSKIGTSNGTNYSDDNISNGKTYYYKVTAANSSNKESSYSNIASVTINTTIVEEPGIKTCSVSKGYNQITISWTYATSSGYSAPDQVRMTSEDPTWTGLADVFSWTTASSKKSHTVKVADLVYGSSKEEYTLYLEVKNSKGTGKGAKIVWNWMNNTGYVMGSLCSYSTF